MMKVDGMRKNLTKKEIEKRRQIESIGKLDSDKLIAPKYFSEVQVAVFDFIKDELIKLDLIDNLDIHALERYVVSYYHYTRVSKNINRMGVNNENFYNNTLLLEKYNKMARESAKDLGLALGERLKLLTLSKLDELDKEDPLLKVLRGGG